MKTSINTGGEFYLVDFGYFSMSVYNLIHLCLIILVPVPVLILPFLIGKGFVSHRFDKIPQVFGSLQGHEYI